MADWPHAPVHRLAETRAYMVTGATYQKAHRLWDAQRLDLMLNRLLALAEEFAWRLQAWAIMSNHYHFVALSPDSAESLRAFIHKLHSQTGKQLNELDIRRGAACGISSTTVI